MNETRRLPLRASCAVLIVLAQLLCMRIGVAQNGYTVQAYAVQKSITLGQVGRINGTVHPMTSSAVAKFYQYVSGGWHLLTSKHPSSNGTFYFTVRPSYAGTMKYKVVVPASAGHASGQSPYLGLDVYRWHYLKDLTPPDQDGFYYSGSTTINGGTYAHSIWDYFSTNGGTHWVEYNLSRRCTHFRTTLGLTDDSPSNYSATMEISVDGNTPVSEQVQAGQALTHDVALGSSYRLHLEAIYPNADTYEWGNAAYGNARIYCRF